MNQEEVIRKLQAGMQALQGGNLDTAEEIFRSILIVDAKEMHSLHFLGVVLCKKGDIFNGALLIERSILIDPSRFYPYYNLGKLLVADKQYGRAIPVLKEALKRDQKSFSAWNLLSKASFHDEDFAGAVDSGQRACELSPDNPEVFFDLGVYFNALKQLDKAVNAYQKAIVFKPDYLEAWVNMGNILTKQGKLEGAIRCFQKVIDLNPDLVDAYFNMGNILKDHTKFEEAIGSYRKAIDLKPDFADVYFALGMALKELGDIDSASAAFEDYYLREPIVQTISLPAIAYEPAMFISRGKQVIVPQSTDFIPSYLSDEIPFGMHLMYLHIPKVGGVRFGNPISDCIRRLFLGESLDKFQDLLSCIFPSRDLSFIVSPRIDSVPIRDGIIRAFDSCGLDSSDFSFLMPHGISSDELFVMLNNLGVFPIRLATWRDPEKRLISALNYLWRISKGNINSIRDRINSRDPFLDNAIYRACFSTFNRPLESYSASELKVDYLIDIGDFSVMNQVMSIYMSRCRLPNIVINKSVNVTSEDDKMEHSCLLQLAEECIDKGFIAYDSSPVIRDLVKKKLPTVFRHDLDHSEDTLNPLTFVVNSTTNIDTSAQMYFSLTEDLTSKMGQDSLKDIYS
ncbi:tetratricopeptide repeat protein [Prochlorococcus marinus]|uniref:tetratricopeptide repeat protein n=1 Tax=Prochlorococcus marinus TaxID=1219 RepID=UPI001F45FF9C|nr:tetratricopeptide repeat protein [Prochlorococcus marinus]